MKTFRRYLTRTLYVLLFVGLFPFAQIAKIILDLVCKADVEPMNNRRFVSDE